MVGILWLQVCFAAKTVPWSTNKSSECVNECINADFIFCPTGLFGFCCEKSRCGSATNCSDVNNSLGAKYLSCLTDTFCGEREHEIAPWKNQITIDAPEFSPASACIYSFGWPKLANLGDVMVVELEDLTRLDLFYASGINESLAKGREVNDPLAGLFKIRYPNNLYLTLLNKDIVRTPLSKPVTVNYWLEPGDPALKAEEYSTDPITPQFALELIPLRNRNDGSDDG